MIFKIYKNEIHFIARNALFRISYFCWDLNLADRKIVLLFAVSVKYINLVENLESIWTWHINIMLKISLIVQHLVFLCWFTYSLVFLQIERNVCFVASLKRNLMPRAQLKKTFLNLFIGSVIVSGLNRSFLIKFSINGNQIICE